MRHEQVAAKLLHHLAPPRHNLAVIVLGTDGPIHLRRNIVNQPFIEPLHDVDILAAIVVVVAHRAFFDAVFVSHRLRGVGGALRSLSEPNPRLGALKHVIELAHEVGDVLATPIGLRERAACRNVGIIQVGILAQGCAVIVIVVEEHAVDIVVQYNFLADVNNAVLHFSQPRIENQPRPAGDGPAFFNVACYVAALTARG